MHTCTCTVCTHCQCLLCMTISHSESYLEHSSDRTTPVRPVAHHVGLPVTVANAICFEKVIHAYMYMYCLIIRPNTKLFQILKHVAAFSKIGKLLM